jgi:hypothetical protein
MRLATTIFLFLLLPYAWGETQLKPTEGCEIPLLGENLTNFDALISSRTPITFEIAVGLIERSLSPLDAQNFHEKLQQNIYGSNVKIKNKAYNFISGRKNKIKQRGPIKSLWLDDAVIWRMRPARGRADLLSLMFDSVRIVYQPDLKSLSSLGVYYSSRDAAKSNLLDVATRVLRTEEALNENERLEDEQLLSQFRPVGLVSEWLKYLFVFPGGKSAWIYKSLRLDTSTSEAIAAGNDNLQSLLSGRMGYAAAVQYYLTHFRNLRRAVYLSVALFLGPNAWGAAEHQWQIENLGLSTLTHSELADSNSYRNESPAKLEADLKATLLSRHVQQLSTPEKDFYSEVQALLTQK